MGYTTHVTGEFTIEPPLTWYEIKDSPFSPFPPAGDDRIELVLRVDEEVVETGDGPLMRRTAAALVMSEIDEYRAHGLLEVVQRAVDSLPESHVHRPPGLRGRGERGHLARGHP
jgi:hypothetical protein